ncbi:MAG: class I SAM-dependent methyltransferase [Acidobacteriota bacterium]|nr:class I SAM-dependent methyltransferase [Acidobacteriota bacterium]
MPVPIPETETRTFERVKDHYQIEKELAARLRAAPKEERRHLYTTVYDELFRRVPDHPQLQSKLDTRARRREVLERVRLLRKYLRPDVTYLEIGPGDCALAIEAARRVRKVFAVDVSREIVAGIRLLKNLELATSDGCSIPVPDGSIDIAYSDQLMEHLHPEDAAEQLANIYRALAPGATYLCITPNRWNGPHDVSRYFDEEATGFHLREYTVSELAQMFREIGFRKVRVLVGGGGSHVSVPAFFVKTLETLLAKLPRQFGRTLARRLPLRVILGAKLIATK